MAPNREKRVARDQEEDEKFWRRIEQGKEARDSRAIGRSRVERFLIPLVT